MQMFTPLKRITYTQLASRLEQPVMLCHYIGWARGREAPESRASWIFSMRAENFSKSFNFLFLTLETDGTYTYR